MEEICYNPAFIADGMLGSVARKLRILGFDTIYDPRSEDQDLLRFAKESHRILLTSDRDLFVNARYLKVRAVLVRGADEKTRLYEILHKSGIGRIMCDSLVSRCSVCNSLLVGAGTTRISYGEVYSCVSCGKKYWKGSHWEKLTELFQAVNDMLV